MGRFSRSGRLDLAVSSPNQFLGDGRTGGVVHVLHGTGRGLAATGNQLWSEFGLSIRKADNDGDPPESYPNLGARLLAADFGHDSADDLVISTPDEDRSGAVTILYGSRHGLTADRMHRLNARTKGMFGRGAGVGHFGQSLATIDRQPTTPGSGAYPMLAIGAPAENGHWDGEYSRGQVHLIRGSAKGLTAVGDQLLRDEDLSRPLSTDFGTALNG